MMKTFLNLRSVDSVNPHRASVSLYVSLIAMTLLSFIATTIVDKERNLRGRKEKKDYKEGYNTFHVSELSNEMLDDFKIILYEYRAALKKNHNATKQL